MISLLIFGTLRESFNKIHIKQLNSLFDAIIFFNVMSGTTIFMRLEPRVALEFGRLWEAHTMQEKLKKITGVTTKIDDLLF